MGGNLAMIPDISSALHQVCVCCQEFSQVYDRVAMGVPSFIHITDKCNHHLMQKDGLNLWKLYKTRTLSRRYFSSTGNRLFVLHLPETISTSRTPKLYTSALRVNCPLIAYSGAK